MEKEIIKRRKEKILTLPILILVVIAIVLLSFNQLQINAISSMPISSMSISGSRAGGATGRSGDLSSVDISKLKSTGQTLAAVFPLGNINSNEDAMAILLPTGTPEYGEALGVSYDDPLKSLEKLSNMYRGLKAEVQKNNPEAWQRFMNLASKPVGISCEYCCGVGPIGIDRNGNSACGCQHNPALLTVALYLTAYTDYSDAEILREVMRWKTLFFPKNMIELAASVAGKDVSELDDLPGMVGGC